MAHLVKDVSESYNQYMTYINNSAFYVLSPAYLSQFYNVMVRKWDEWNNGWVEDFHSIEHEILPTQLAGSLCEKVADLIYGEGVLFENSKEDDDTSSLDFIGEKDNEIDIKGNVKDSILKSTQLGNALLKLNLGSENNLWIDTIAGNRFFVNLNSRGKIEKAVTYVNMYTTGIKEKGKPQDSYGLVEERFYLTDDEGNRVLRNGNAVPCVVYKIYKLAGVSNVFDPNASGTSIKFEDLPRAVSRAFREEYNDLMLDEVTELEGMRNLGVYLVKHTAYVRGLPNIKLGESCLAKVINYLPQYDAINSEELIDLRISRPKVLVPDFMQKGKEDNDPLNQYHDIMFARIPNKSDKEQMPIVYAPTPREEHFIRMKEDVIKKICGNLGIATSSLFSDIYDLRGQVTAREISSENSNTALYQSNKRKLVIPAVNEMISDILYFYGLQENVKCAFTPAGASNKTIMTDINVKLKQNGLISEYQAIKNENPDWTDKQIESELEKIHANSPEKEPNKPTEETDTNEGNNTEM